MARPRLIVFTRHSPLPETDGAGAGLFALLSYLASRGTKIEVVWLKAEGSFVRDGKWKVPPHVSKVADVRVIGSLAVGSWRFFWWGPLEARILGFIKDTLQFFRLLPRPAAAPVVAASANSATTPAAPVVHHEPSWSALPTRLETRFALRRLKRFRPNAILANYCWMTPLFPANNTAHTLVFTHDVASHRLSLPGQKKASSDAMSADQEAALLNRADTLLAVSEDDAAVFRGMTPGKKILNIFKAAEVQQAKGTPASGRCLFVGGVNPPNEEGLRWFLTEVWPLILARVPHATLHVCGGICGTVQSIPAGVTLHGRVPSLASAYGEAEVVVVPLLQGTGIKIKMIEACSFGKAVVTTSVGLQGLPFFNPAVVEANDPAGFAEGVERVLHDSALRDRLGHDARNAVATHLSPESCYGHVYTALKDPASSRKAQ